MNTDNIKQKLEEEKNLLEAELSSLGRVDKETGDWEAVPEAQTAPEADENDLADRAEDYEERSSTLSVLEARLTDIKVALDKIGGGKYGVCEACGNPIEEDRLGANPAARTCKGCMEKVI
jgi:RNA polymerase-binding transcription factor DksA